LRDFVTDIRNRPGGHTQQNVYEERKGGENMEKSKDRRGQGRGPRSPVRRLFYLQLAMSIVGEGRMARGGPPRSGAFSGTAKKNRVKGGRKKRLGGT